MTKQWYVVHTYSGFERKAKAALEERVKMLGKQEYFADILVPEEQVIELIKGRKRTSARKFFPGYILVNMEMNDETWHVVKSTPKVTGFVGGTNDPSTIPSVSEVEVSEIHQQVQEGSLRPKQKCYLRWAKM
jgi:transcriptional antiterminator NusG